MKEAVPAHRSQRRLWKELRARERVRVFFDRAVVRRTRERRRGAGRRSQRVRGGVELTMRIFPDPDFVAWLLSCGDKAEVGSPRKTPKLDQCLALVDAIRGGRARERQLAEKHLRKLLGPR